MYPLKIREYPATCGAHDSVVEEEKRRRVVNKNFKTMRLANAETKKKYQKVSLARTWTRLVKGGIFGD